MTLERGTGKRSRTRQSTDSTLQNRHCGSHAFNSESKTGRCGRTEFKDTQRVQGPCGPCCGAVQKTRVKVKKTRKLATKKTDPDAARGAAK